ncbi:DUF3466 domain-containing protein [Photobacterium sanctipauli]|uniref:DUF3466 domain-containing protein n=1 Tax=Photobacterium sanctipauli TaxID=1342794 RepID=A0A2T3NII9_9GAMM|nr:DUF3466 family protein [Photobacterium sanctipauli]PSW14824.1 DUF3466 domain-containing protein [Photobacterium sanctipauli]
MQHKTLKLSTLAILIAGATHANAAVYRVVEVDASKEVANNQYFPQVTADLNDSIRFYGQGLFTASSRASCFTEECDETEYLVYGESRLGADGINYRDEVPFLSDNYQEVNDVIELERYCDRNLGPNTCENWARTQFYGSFYNENDRGDRTGLGGFVRELEAWSQNYYSNATAMVESGQTLSPLMTFADESSGYSDEVKGYLGTIVDSVGQHKSTNSVVNSAGTSSLGDYKLGVTSAAYFYDGSRYARQFNKRGFVNAGTSMFGLEPIEGQNNEQEEGQSSVNSDELIQKAGQTLAWDAVEYNGNLLVVGSASFNPSNFRDSDKVPDRDISTDPNYNSNSFRDCLDDYFATSNNTPNLDAFYNTRECQISVFANDAAFWTIGSDEQLVARSIAERVDRNGVTYEALDPDNRDRTFQGSARAVELVDGSPVIVGFTTDSINKESINEARKDYYAVRAAVYELKFDSTGSVAENQWERKIIPGLPIEDNSGDRRLTYSIATDVNQNNMVVGVAKNYFAENRSYAERIFVFDNNTDTVSYIDETTTSTDVFFAGANGYPAAINKHDQVVGRVDSETANQVDGKFRRQRGFTYIAGSDIADSPLTSNKAWLLDDLTYGGEDDEISIANNQFRIADATGITDDGVISATAFKCEGGYDTFTKESFCKGGEPNAEKQVAVKLIPVPAGEIQARPAEEETIKRQGASLGIFALTLLGWLGFRRRK